MNSRVVNISIFLFLTVQGTLGSELTINVRRNASVTLICAGLESLLKCCPATPQNCHKCTDFTRLSTLYETYDREKHFKLSGLKPSDSGLYACFYSYQQLGQKYRLNVFEDKNPTVVIGTVGKSIILSCGSELDNISSSEKHWCRLENATLCQPDTLMGPGNDTRGDFKILATNSSVCLEKRQLTHNDTGLYRFTQSFQNQTKVHVVELQVKDKPSFSQISCVRDRPDELQIKCQYTQEMLEFPKYWLCDSKACPDTVRCVDDRFQSALVLTIDHAACSKIKSFMCVAKTPERSMYSDVYSKPPNRNPIANVEVSYFRNEKVRVKPYNQLNLICYKRERYYYDYDRYDVGTRGKYGPFYWIAYWCRVRNTNCPKIEEDVEDTGGSLKLQICVKPSDDGARYRCHAGRAINVEIVVIAPPPPPPPPPRPGPHTPTFVEPTPNSSLPSTGIIVVLISMFLLLIAVLVTVYRFQGPKLMERLFARRTVLSAVDTHANMYANLVANYYSNNRRIVLPPDKQGEGDDKEDSSSSDDEFEELPVRPQRPSSITHEETDYVRVQPGRAAQAQSVGYSSKTNKDKMGKKQRQGTARSSGHTESKEEEDDDEVTYTHVIIKPKQQPK